MGGKEAGVGCIKDYPPIQNGVLLTLTAVQKRELEEKANRKSIDI